MICQTCERDLKKQSNEYIIVVTRERIFDEQHRCLYGDQVVDSNVWVKQSKRKLCVHFHLYVIYLEFLDTGSLAF